MRVRSNAGCSSGCEGWLGHSPPWVAVAARRESETGPGFTGAVATEDHHCPVRFQLNSVHCLSSGCPDLVCKVSGLVC